MINDNFFNLLDLLELQFYFRFFSNFIIFKKVNSTATSQTELFSNQSKVTQNINLNKQSIRKDNLPSYQFPTSSFILTNYIHNIYY